MTVLLPLIDNFANSFSNWTASSPLYFQLFSFSRPWDCSCAVQPGVKQIIKDDSLAGESQRYSLKLCRKWGLWNSLGSSENGPSWCNKLLQPQNKSSMDANLHPGRRVLDVGLVDFHTQDVNINITYGCNNKITACYSNNNENTVSLFVTATSAIHGLRWLFLPTV